MDLDDAGDGDFHVGAAEETDADADIGGAVLGELHNLGCIAVVLETGDADMFADRELGGEVDIVVLLTEHGFEEAHLGVVDDGDGPDVLLGILPGRIHHEGIDEGEMAYHFGFGSGNLHEDHTVDHHQLYLLALSVAPFVKFPTCGDL